MQQVPMGDVLALVAAVGGLAVLTGVLIGIMTGSWLYSARRHQSLIVPEGMEQAVREQQAEMIQLMAAQLNELADAARMTAAAQLDGTGA